MSGRRKTCFDVTVSERIWRAQGWRPYINDRPEFAWTKGSKTVGRSALPYYEHDISACFRDLVPDIARRKHRIFIEMQHGANRWYVNHKFGEKGDEHDVYAACRAICNAWLAIKEEPTK